MPGICPHCGRPVVTECPCGGGTVPTFDEQRQKLARQSREDAAAHADPTEARLLEMCADDLSQPVPDWLTQWLGEDEK